MYSAGKENASRVDRAAHGYSTAAVSDGQPGRRRSSQQPTEQARPAKRRRAALACGSCRARKSRCDGVRPTCSMCEELGFDCRYQQPAAYPNAIIGKEYLSSIEERLKVVETRLFSLETLTPRDSTGPENPGPRALIPKNGYQLAKVEPTVETACVAEDAESSAGKEDSIDGMGAVSFAPEEDCAFFGASSNISLLRDISRAVSRIARTGKPWVPSPVTQQPDTIQTPSRRLAGASPPSSLRYSFSDPYTSSDAARNERKINIYALPPEPLTRELIHRYFSNTGQLFPYIHYETFVEKYNQMKQNKFRDVQRMWLGLLNVVFAMATSVSLSPCGEVSGAAKQALESEIYYQRASGLCSERIALGKGMNLDTVQYLLLMCQYLQGTQKSVQTWITHGLAVKVAMQLGLHSSEASRGRPPLEQEIRKRTWFACVTLDRTLSMTFGRPSNVLENHVKFDLPVPYSSIDPEFGVDKLDETGVSFFNSTISLYRVMSSVIELLYEQNLGHGMSMTASETVACVFKLENELVQWQRISCRPGVLPATELPAAITAAVASAVGVPSNEDGNLVPASWWPLYDLRLRVIITLRYNNLRILLHRPILTSLLMGAVADETRTDGVSIIQQVGASSVQACTRSAKEIISIISLIVHSEGPARGLLGAWWFSLYYTFNAALVIVAGVLISIQENDDSSPTTVSYSQDAGLYLLDAIEALRALDSERRMITRCREYLEQLVQVVQSLLYSRGQRIGFEFQLPGIPSEKQHTTSQNSEENDTSSPNGYLTSCDQHQVMQEQSPLGIELGEFFMDRDLNFLNDQMFDFGQ